MITADGTQERLRELQNAWREKFAETCRIEGRIEELLYLSEQAEGAAEAAPEAATGVTNDNFSE